jgi:CRISPR-associated protein Cmr5
VGGEPVKEKTLDQRRAADALEKIKLLEKDPRRGKFDSYVDSLPATILMSGLGQATAMLLASAKFGKENRSDDNRAYETLYRHLSSWLCRDEDDAPYRGAADLMEAITKDARGEDAYIHAQAEAMAYLEWLKKFSNAYLKD